MWCGQRSSRESCFLLENGPTHSIIARALQRSSLAVNELLQPKSDVDEATNGVFKPCCWIYLSKNMPWIVCVYCVTFCFIYRDNIVYRTVQNCTQIEYRPTLHTYIHRKYRSWFKSLYWHTQQTKCNGMEYCGFLIMQYHSPLKSVHGWSTL